MSQLLLTRSERRIAMTTNWEKWVLPPPSTPPPPASHPVQSLCVLELCCQRTTKFSLESVLSFGDNLNHDNHLISLRYIHVLLFIICKQALTPSSTPPHNPRHQRLKHKSLVIRPQTGARDLWTTPVPVARYCTLHSQLPQTRNCVAPYAAVLATVE